MRDDHIEGKGNAVGGGQEQGKEQGKEQAGKKEKKCRVLPAAVCVPPTSEGVCERKHALALQNVCIIKGKQVPKPHLSVEYAWACCS